MELNNKNTYIKRDYEKLNIRFNLTSIAIFLFALFITTYKSFVLSIMGGVLLLGISILLLCISNFFLSNKGISLNIVNIMWLFFILLIFLNIFLNNLITSSTILDLYFYIVAVLFLMMAKFDLSSYSPSLKLIRIAGVVYAISAVLQYLFIDFYIKYIVPLFTASEQKTILQLLSAEAYSGFTSQTAYLAGYIVSGIGITIFSDWKVKLPTKIALTLFIIIMFAGLLFTTKRAHIIFLIIAIFVTVLFSLNKKKFIINATRLIMSVIVLFLIIFLLYSSVNLNENSPFTGLVSEINDTVYGIIEGEDVTSGRSVLYARAWELFIENPLIGIGWEEFRNTYSIGLINSDIGSHPHNIYLQLLAENGIIGFISFISPLLYVYYRTYCLLRYLSSQIIQSNLWQWKHAVQFSFFYQTFFILYGMTGNLLTDYTFLLMYYFVCSISLSAIYNIRSSVNRKMIKDTK